MIVSGTKQCLMDQLLVSMNKSKSAKEGFGLADFLRCSVIEEDTVSAMEEELPSVIVGSCCRSCKSTKPFQSGSDSSRSCSDCGAVNQDCELVSLTHTKACPSIDDPTTTADEVRDVNHLGGVETASQTVRRHVVDCAASTLSVRAKRRLGVAQADAEIKRRAVQDHRATIKVSQASERFNRAVQIAIHKFFSGVKAHETLQSLVRKTAFDVILKNQAHQECCDPSTCDLHVADTSAAIFALVLIRVLAEDASVAHGALAEVGKLELLRIVDSANSAICHQEGGVAVSKATQGIRLTLATTDITIPCTGAVPTGLLIAKTESTDSLASKTVFSIRDSIWASYNLIRFSSSLRDYTLRALGSGMLETWVDSLSLSADLTAAILLASCARMRAQTSSVASSVLTSDVTKTEKQLQTASNSSKVSAYVVEAVSNEVRGHLDVEVYEHDDL